MCGIAGFLSDRALRADDAATTVLRAMGEAIFRRGPDSGDVWADTEAGIGLAHRRLAIVDLSRAGAQPMTSPSGRYVIAYNGEIYNHMDLRAQLEAQGRAPDWRGHSDTETLLAAIEAWGLETALQRAIGMFAIALWDRERRRLALARDRLGEKPLYYGWQAGRGERCFLFGSELKALKAHPAFSAPINRDAITLLLRHNYIPAPYSIHEGISKLEPGRILTVHAGAPQGEETVFWDAVQAALEARSRPFAGSADDAVDALERVAKDAVRQQMMADVPLGAFLSGGIDSSTVVALMQSQSSRPIKTFTIGFDEAGYNEAEHAKAVARHLGTEHTELYVSPQQALDIIPRLPGIYCEPFADSSQVPTFLVSQLARQHVTVSLSGDAGDELFGGYTRYTMTERWWGRISATPRFARHLLAKTLTSVDASSWDRLAGVLLPARHASSRIGAKLHKGAAQLMNDSIDDLYLGLNSHHQSPEEWVPGTTEPATRLTGRRPDLSTLGGVERMMLLDSISYLPDDILTKVDRAAMSVSLETRVPFLDHRVFEFAWSLPMAYKLRGGVGKWPLRQLLYRHVPRELIDRPKMGFGIPIEHWLRGPLREWAESLLDDARLRREGYFDSARVQAMWQDNLAGAGRWHYHLWDILMFQAWLEANP